MTGPSPAWARAALVAILGLGAWEALAGILAYRDRIDAQDWSEVRTAVAALGDEPVFLADDWLDPIARAQLGPASLASGVPDLRGASTFHVLGFENRRWSPALQSDLEDLPVPRWVASRRLGDLLLTTYAQDAEPLRSDLTGSVAKVDTDGSACRGRGPWRCRDGTIEVREVEIDHRARTCVSIDLSDGSEARLQLSEIDARRLRGHVGFSDYNGRLRSDAPATVVIEREGSVLGRWVFTDEQGWAPFAVDLPAGSAPLLVRVRTATRGTWGKDGYAATEARPVCIELRAFGGEP